MFVGMFGCLFLYELVRLYRKFHKAQATGEDNEQLYTPSGAQQGDCINEFVM